MALLFYRRPDYLNPADGPINASDCARYIERAKNSDRAIPPGLSFDEVINDKALPPCSLNDFMDYLVYVERNAENLQFLLFYRDYMRRFDALPKGEKALSPPWTQDEKGLPHLPSDSHESGNSGGLLKKKAKKIAITAMMETGYDHKRITFFPEIPRTPVSPSLPVPPKSEVKRSSLPWMDTPAELSDAELARQAGMKWQPFTIQPMRDDVNRVMRHYLAFGAPRELNLSHKDRAQCLHALQHTTHPSALLPAVKIAEAALRGQSHPNFIRWSICNGNKPRVLFVRCLGIIGITIGFLTATLLTLSKASRWWRIFAASQWFIGFATIVAAYKGLCIIMHYSHSRALRPWEQARDLESADGRKSSTSSSADRCVQVHSRSESYDSTLKVDIDSILPSNLRSFGPENSFDSATWFEAYERKPLMRKIFEKSVWTENETLRLLQDRIVLGAVIWSLIITVPLTSAFVALPNGNFY